MSKNQEAVRTPDLVLHRLRDHLDLHCALSVIRDPTFTNFCALVPFCADLAAGCLRSMSANPGSV